VQRKAVYLASGERLFFSQCLTALILVAFMHVCIMQPGRLFSSGSGVTECGVMKAGTAGLQGPQSRDPVSAPGTAGRRGRFRPANCFY